MGSRVATLDAVPESVDQPSGRYPLRPTRFQTYCLLIFILALGPRLLARDLFPTSDEDSWMRRSGGFTYGLLNGQLGRTYQNGHPGVTTMWVATLSQGPSGALRFADRVHGMRFVGQVPGYLEGLTRARTGFALLAALGTAVAALLLWRLFGPTVALLAGAALALEPFLVANAQLVHVDGPLATFTTVSMLAALVRWRTGRGRGFLFISGVTAGLALLSKSPALFLLLFVPLVALLPALAQRSWVRALLDLLIWGGVAVGTVVAFWPALWTLGPTEVLGRIVAFTRETGGQPDEVGSFFLGVVGADPGPLYYPVATLFRLSPFVTLGLVALVMLHRRLAVQSRGLAGWLLLFVLGFALMMTLGPKKFDRYLLPIFPALVALAALGWSLVLSGLSGRLARVAVSGGLLLVAAWPLASTYPYPLAYYNPLFGGGATAQRAVMVGNGEGLDQAAGWIAKQPESADPWVAAHSFDILAAMIPGQGEPLRDGVPSDADYIVTYGRRIQMQRWGRSLEQYFAENPPIYTVWINGIEYARVHPGPRRAAVGSRQ
ncbi:MAG: glycosyltransferase family 39 protein [Chloroflexi bacterium]|nr:glycosyltransferase family 39 protein [Chloroflexota bacterium]